MAVASFWILKRPHSIPYTELPFLLVVWGCTSSLALGKLPRIRDSLDKIGGNRVSDYCLWFGGSGHAVLVSGSSVLELWSKPRRPEAYHFPGSGGQFASQVRMGEGEGLFWPL